MDDCEGESKVVVNGNQEKVVVEEEVDESKELLLPKKGGLSKKKSGKKQRKVQWNDRNGSKLTEVLEYQPSDVSDSEDEESDACICNIM